jgi:sigma-E factor negative regulatory protein RseC
MSNAASEVSMLEETGKVVAIEGQYVVIETEPRSACGHCNVGDSCGTSVLAGIFSKRRNRVRLENHLDLSVGDMTVIGINESVLLSTAVLAYILPLILMIIPAVILSVSGFDDGISFIVSMLGLFGGMQISNRIMGDKEFPSREIILLRNANDVCVQSLDANTV